MSTSALTLRHVFGLKGDVRSCLHFFDEAHVIYPAGHNIVVYNTETRTQYKIQPVGDQKDRDVSPTRAEITAMALSSNRKFLAVAERGERPGLTIFDVSSIGLAAPGATVVGGALNNAAAAAWKKRRPTFPTEISSSEVVCVAFSGDAKLLLTLSGAPDWSLTLWQWEKARAVNSIRVSNSQGAAVHHCSFCPNDPNFVCVTGNGILRFFRVDLQGGDFKPVLPSLGKREPQHYTCHTWTDDRLLVGTDTGDILTFSENGDFRGALASPCEGHIETIVPYSKGFICGMPESVLQMYEKDDKDGFRKKTPFNIKHNAASKITNIAIAPSEDALVCSTDNNQIFTLPLSTSSTDGQEPKFDWLSHPFHHMVVTGMDVCVRKPLLVTCGLDKSVRIWNYQECTLDLMRFFAEEPYSVAFHPSGLHILVGFIDKLRLMNLLIEDIRPFKEFPIKACREVQFSHGGQYFAAVNGSTIQIFSTYTGENIGNCRGHNGKVRSVHWSSDDSTLVSCGMDGAVYEWELKEGTHTQEYIQKGCNFAAACISNEGKVYAAGSDHSIKEITESQATASFDTALNLSCLALSSRFLLAGSEGGAIKQYKLPLNGQSIDAYVHSAPVVRLRVTSDDSLCFSTGEDGCVVIYEVSGKEKTKKDKEVSLPFAEEILVTKADLEEKLNAIAELKNKVEELQLHNEYQSRLREMNYQEKLRDVTEVFNKELSEDRQNFELLTDEKDALEKQYTKRIAFLRAKHSEKIEQVSLYHERKLESERQRTTDLKKKLDVSVERWEDAARRRAETNAAAIAQMQTDYEKQLKQEEQECSSIQKDKASIETEFDENKRNLELDADMEIDDLKTQFDKKIWQEKEIEQKYAAENGILKLRYHGLKEEIEMQKEDIKRRFEKEKSLYEQIHILEKDIEGFKKEISERDATIDDKKKRIYDLRKKNQELEKFKFVLDYKIKELRRQIEPREIEIKDMQQQWEEMEVELNQYRKDNNSAKLLIRELELKELGLQKEITKQSDQNSVVNDELTAAQTDLHDVYDKVMSAHQKRLAASGHAAAKNAPLAIASWTTAKLPDILHSEELKMLKSGILRLYHKHVTHELRAEDDPDINKEYQRQRQFLEKNIDSLNRKLQKDAAVSKKDNLRIIQENVALIKEINELRKEVKYLADPPPPKPSMSSRRNSASGSRPHSSSGLPALPAQHTTSSHTSGVASGMASGAAGGTAFGASRLPAMLQSIEEQRQLIRALEDHVDGLMLQTGQRAASRAMLGDAFENLTIAEENEQFE